MRRNLIKPQRGFRWLTEKGVLSFGLGFVALVSCLFFLQTGAGKTWETQTLDARFQTRGQRVSHSPVVVIAVDDATEQNWAEPMAFWGTHYARVLRAAQKAGASVVALDAVPAVDADSYLADLNVPEDTRPDTDLARALMEGGGKIVMASLLNVGGKPKLPAERFQYTPGVMENIGFVDLLPDADGIVRAMPYAAANNRDRSENYARPAFAALAAARFLNRNVNTVSGRPFPDAAINDDGLWMRFWPNQTGRPFFTLSALRVEKNTLTPAEREKLRGALVFVGMTATIANDRYHTSFPDTTPGVYLHADAAASLLDELTLHFPPAAFSRDLCLVAGLAALLVGGFLPVRVGFPIGAFALLGIICGAQWAFTRHNLVLPLGGLLLCAFLPCAVQQAAIAVEERVRRQYLRGLLGRSVSPQVRDYLLQSPDHLQLNGVERDAVILFFDIRGSLTFAESRTPTETLRQLNDFFARVVPVLEKHHGLLYRYTGDGFLAVFGAPDVLPDAPAYALRAAVELVEAVAQVNQSRQEKNEPPLPVGCGLHGGPVICGNLGVAERSDFTVIGDVVNRAARLESCNKDLKSEIVVSRTVWERIPDPKPMGFIGPAKVAITGSGRGEDVYYRPAILAEPIV